MELFVVRHAAAVPGAEDLPDAERPLTPKGRRRFRRVVRGLASLSIEFDRILHSPLVRAIETAELLAPLSVRGETEVTPHLSRSPDESLLALLAGERVAVVGHQPWLGELVAWLCVGSKDRENAFELAKGSVAWLSGEPSPGAMAVVALVTPRIVTRLRR